MVDLDIYNPTKVRGIVENMQRDLDALKGFAVKAAQYEALLRDLISIEGPQPGHFDWYIRVCNALGLTAEQARKETLFSAIKSQRDALERECLMRGKQIDDIKEQLASQVAWKERYIRDLLQAGELIRLLEAALVAVDEDWTEFWRDGPDSPPKGFVAISERTIKIWKRIRAALVRSRAFKIAVGTN